MDSPTVLADGRFSLIDGALAGAVLSGLLLTAVVGWWWADALLAGLIALLALREGIGAWLEHDGNAPAARI
jgi:divalent metal cation (Fe/Co/Zn/Cd) transporter